MSLVNCLKAYEIIRDPIFENYFDNISQEYNIKNVKVYLVKSNNSNAFVLNDSIYFTTNLINEVNSEDTIKAIYFHEYGHLINNHLEAKKLNIQKISDRSSFLNLFSIGLAVISGNSNIGIGTGITLNNNLISEISRHSINFEIEADNFMIGKIDKYKINTSELITFLNKNNNNSYFKTHPNSSDRINNIKEFNYNTSINSNQFNWIKAKYSNNSVDETYNAFFQNIAKGLYDQSTKINNINNLIVQYEVFKKGIIIKDWEENFKKLLLLIDDSFLKIEYINYILDNDLNDNFYHIENLKFDKNIMQEYFYYYIYGKYYNKIDEYDLSNFYFCQFYKSINSSNKADFFCGKYDTKNIPLLDKSYALFK